MDWVECPESSNVARFKYEEASRILTVEFKHGGSYEYYDVPEHIFVGMQNAPSRGQFLAQQIKGVYRYARM